MSCGEAQNVPSTSSQLVFAIWSFPVDLLSEFARYLLSRDLLALIMTGNASLGAKIRRSVQSLLLESTKPEFNFTAQLCRASLFSNLQSLSLANSSPSAMNLTPIPPLDALARLVSLTLRFPNSAGFFHKHLRHAATLWPSLESLVIIGSDFLSIEAAKVGSFDLSILPSTIRHLRIEGLKTVTIKLSEIMALPKTLELLSLKCTIHTEHQAFRFPWPSIVEVSIATPVYINWDIQSLPTTVQVLKLHSNLSDLSGEDFRVLTPTLRSLDLSNQTNQYCSWDILERLPPTVQELTIFLSPTLGTMSLETAKQRVASFVSFQTRTWLLELLPYFSKLKTMDLSDYSLEKSHALPYQLEVLTVRNIATLDILPPNLIFLDLRSISELASHQTDNQKLAAKFPPRLQVLTLSQMRMTPQIIEVLPESLTYLSGSFPDLDCVADLSRLPNLKQLVLKLISASEIDQDSLLAKIPTSLTELTLRDQHFKLSQLKGPSPLPPHTAFRVIHY